MSFVKGSGPMSGLRSLVSDLWCLVHSHDSVTSLVLWTCAQVLWKPALTRSWFSSKLPFITVIRLWKLQLMNFHGSIFGHPDIAWINNDKWLLIMTLQMVNLLHYGQTGCIRSSRLMCVILRCVICKFGEMHSVHYLKFTINHVIMVIK